MDPLLHGTKTLQALSQDNESDHILVTQLRENATNSSSDRDKDDKLSSCCSSGEDFLPSNCQ